MNYFFSLIMSGESYFNIRAEKYNIRFQKGILGKIRKLEEKSVLKNLSPKENESILDIPCGAGYYAVLLRESGADVFGIDISENMVAEFKRLGFEGVVGDLEDFYVEKKVDKVLSAGGFEFCKRHGLIMNNLLLSVKSGGVVVILLPRKCFFGYLYKLYHLILHKANIVLFSSKDIEKLIDHAVIESYWLESCGLFSYVIKIMKLR